VRTECSGGDKLTHTMATMVPRPSSARRSQREGLLFSLTAAAGFSTTGIFAKLAYAAHVHVATLLSLRFLVASALLWLVIVGTRQPLPSKRTLLLGLLLGLVGYGLQVTLLFLSLKRIDAALSSLLFYSYPAMVTVGAVLLGRERMTRRRGIALAVAMAGVLLVFSTAASSRRDTTGVLLSVASALVYAALILIADRLGREVGPLVLSTLVPTGAAVTFVLGGLLLGDLRLDVTLPGWEAMLGLALVATVVPLAAFYAGIARVGPSTASILLTVEPALTVVLAAVVLNERLGPPQLVGGLLVLAAVLVLQLQRRGGAIPAPAG